MQINNFELGCIVTNKTDNLELLTEWANWKEILVFLGPVVQKAFVVWYPCVLCVHMSRD